MDNKKRYILESMKELKALQGTRLTKYTRNFRLYEATRGISLDNYRSNNSIGFYKDSSDYETSPDISLNIIKSCIDTLTSDISSLKVRPYFSTVNGTWKDIQVTKTAQRYFDQMLEYRNVASEVASAFKNAAIFDTGYIFINPFDNSIKSVLPWQVYIRPAETTYGQVTRVYYELKDYPTSAIDGYKGNLQYTTYGYYFDTKQHIAARLLADAPDDDKAVEIMPYEADEIPFLPVSYSKPVLGQANSSVADVLASIQVAINFLLNRYKDASQKNPAQTFFVPEGSNIETYKLSNEVGNLITYSMNGNMTGSPVTVSTPQFIDGQYLDGVERLKKLAYEMVGLSETSATGQKQKGINSGIMLETMDNIESERFQLQTDMIVRLYKDIARVFMSVVDKNEDILKSDMFTSSFKWADIVAIKDKMKLQFSSADNTSKDPSVKIQMVQMLRATGLVSNELLLQMLELPDVDLAYNYDNNSFNAIQQVLSRCLENNVYDVPAFVSWPGLMAEILNTQLMLFAADPIVNEESIMKLTKLFEVVYTKSQKMSAFGQGKVSDGYTHGEKAPEAPQEEQTV